MAIPARKIANIIPNVLSAGGQGLDMIGMLLTGNARFPVGVAINFSSASAVAEYFGPLSDEADMATVYFNGYTGSNIKPAGLWFYRCATSDAPAFLRGGSVAGMTLGELQDLTGVLTINVSGTDKTSGTIDLTGATSFSNAAAIIQAAFTTPGFTVSYDVISGGFQFTTTADGAGVTLGYATGTLSAPLMLTAATGATTSAGADVSVPAALMDEILDKTQNFITFSTVFHPDTDTALEYAAWANAQDYRFAFVEWDADAASINPATETSFADLVQQNEYASVICNYAPVNGRNAVARVMGAIASVNTQATNGRATMAFRMSDLPADVTTLSMSDTLDAKGSNYIGQFSTSNDDFTFYYKGQISGDFRWIDSWYCNVWLNDAMQLTLVDLMTSIGQLPYNAEGYALIENALSSGPIADGLNFGAIRAGVTLSETQRAAINNTAGFDVAAVIEQRGWYILIQDASPAVRAARGSPPIFVWYTDGQSVQSISLTSTSVQ